MVNKMYLSFGKRSIDLVLSFLGLVLLSPIILLFSILIKCTSKGPILFKQVRVGKDHKAFTIYKFRSMFIETPKDMPTHLLENPDSFITPIGKFMRKTSIDELPQLVNILKGEMSIIGPRPSLFKQEDLNALRDRNGSSAIKPGLTGLAQISGRDELEIEIKAQLDGEYASHITLFKDISLFFGTILSVLKSDGVKEGKKN